jgi:hypothetical protein
VFTGLVLAGFTVASAQTGGLTVIVTDPEGVPLPGATVTISHETSFVKTTAVMTNDRGMAEFPVLRPGPGYMIQVSFPGFASLQFPDLRVKIGEEQKLPVQLTEEIVERVKVQTEGEVIDI